MKFQRSILAFLGANAIAVALIFALVTSCKKDDNTTPSGPTNLTTIAGSWKLTSINVNPPVPFSGLTISEILGPLSTLVEPNCANNVVLTFNTNGSIANNAATITACNSATISKQLVDAFFSSATSYTETASQLTLKTGTQSIIATKALSTSTATLTTQLPVSPLNQPTPTSYTMVLTKQ